MLVYWVEVPGKDGNPPVFPASRSEKDKVFFKLKEPLSDEAMVATDLIVPESSGVWKHRQSQANAAKYKTECADERVDLETYDLIKQWCRSQPEGCEEAFLFMGIENREHPRFQEYKSRRLQIIEDQKSKKSKKTS